VRAIVRYIANYGESGPTVGAVYEGVKIAAVARIKHFPQTIVTDSYIRRDESLDGDSTLAGNNSKIPVTVARNFKNCHVRYSSQRRGFTAQTQHEVIYGVQRPLNLNGHAGRSVADIAGQAPFCGETIYVGPEPYSLDNAGDRYVTPYVHNR
jgi:hypothetical protein